MLNRFKNDAGFTLVELLVVILILGILLAIALPSFLNAQNSAKDADAKTRLNTGYKVAKQVAAENEGSFGDKAAVEAAILASEGSSLGIDATGTSGSSLALAITSGSGKSCTLSVSAGVLTGPSCS